MILSSGEQPEQPAEPRGAREQVQRLGGNVPPGVNRGRVPIARPRSPCRATVANAAPVAYGGRAEQQPTPPATPCAMRQSSTRPTPVASAAESVSPVNWCSGTAFIVHAAMFSASMTTVTTDSTRTVVPPSPFARCPARRTG